MSFSVYKHTAPDGKVYIGFTGQKPEEHWADGKGYTGQTRLYKAIKKHGWDNFKHEILAEGLSEEEAKEQALSLIAEYDSTNPKKGYNSERDGQPTEEALTRARENKAAKKANGGKRTTLEEILDDLETVTALSRGGHSIKTIAAHFGVGRSTFYDYMNAYPDISDAIKKGKAILVTDVKSALTKRALGYDFEETTTIIRQEKGKQYQSIEKKMKHQPPDVGACHLLLKNLDEDWHNDDISTIKMKKKELELKEKKTEADTW